MLNLEPWVDAVHEASGAGDAVREAVLHRVDLVLMDLRLGEDGDGVEVTRRLLAARPAAVVVVVTMVADDEEVARALEAGARGYVLKTCAPDELCAALALARRGGIVLGPGLGPPVLAAAPRVGSIPPPFDRLTPRELELAQHLARGDSNLRMARGLGISEKTVRNQVSSLLVKLGVPDRVAAVLLAREAGLDPPPP